jgi:ABC-type enterochelin transport system ATPase subunit
MTTTATRSAPDQILEFERNAAAFEQLHDSLLQAYEGHYVAVSEGRVVASGPDDEVVAADLFARLGDASFFLGRVERAATVLEVPSPEVLG